LYLKKIVDQKKREMEQNTPRESPVELKEKALRFPPPRCFKSALTREEGVAIIAEIKRASPSRGDLFPELEPGSLARAYQEGGASALSVLTEGSFFRGSLEDLRKAREAVNLPVLRKDFLLEPWQVMESRLAGADALLFIVKILSAARLQEMITLAREMRMSCLVEVTGKGELYRALEAGAEIIGVNNRDLHTFHTDPRHTSRLAHRVPPEVPLVSESGIYCYRQVEELSRAGVRAVLVGETLVCSNNPGDKIKELKGNSNGKNQN